jgi:uncharacterized membrane protein YqjE
VPTHGPNPLLVAITAILLAVYLGITVWAFMSPATDPQRGMAQGFITMVLLFLLGLGGLVWYGVHSNRSWLVWMVFGICALPSLSLVGRGVYLLVRWLQRR